MRHRRCIVSGLTTISVALCLLGSGRVFASPELADEQTLSNGANLYALYCSECHGDPVKRLDKQDESNNAVDYSELIAIAQGKTAPAGTAIPNKEEWPAWAERPDPGEETEPDERTEILNVVTAVIEQAHGIKPGSGELENPGGNSNNKGGGFEPMPGATDLSNPQTFFYGTSEEEVFKSIANGTGAAMPGWRTELGSDEAIWDLVHYIRSFWGEEWL
jgi:mono/diheme cytochrome c family protein